MSPKAQHFRFEDDQWFELINANGVVDAINAEGRHLTEAAVHRYKWTADHGDNINLARRLRRWCERLDGVPKLAKEPIRAVKGLRQLINDPELRDALLSGTVGELPMSDDGVTIALAKLETSLQMLPEQRQLVASWLRILYERIHYTGGPQTSGDAELLVHLLAFIVQKYSSAWKLARPYKGRQQAWEFVIGACKIAADGTPYKIDLATIDRHVADWIWERRFERERGMSPESAVSILVRNGMIDGPLPTLNDADGWRLNRKATQFWKEGLEPRFKASLAKVSRSERPAEFQRLLQLWKPDNLAA